MEEKITLDMLTQDSVSVRKQNVTTINGVDYVIGKPCRKAYMNSAQGRIEVQAELDTKYVTAIFAVWGDTAIVVSATEI